MYTVQGRMIGKRVDQEVAPEPAEGAEIQAARQDPAAFRPLYERYYRRILGFVYNRVEDKDLAFDITSQVFYEAMRSLHRYTSRGLPFSAWLFRIALNVLGKHFRSGQVKRTVSITHEGMLIFQDDCGGREEDKQLYVALQSLQEEEMQLVEMRYFEDRPYAEIATILGITESAAKQRMYKIIEKLKENMKGINS